METKVIYFVHGTTVDNVAGKCSGWKQAELTEIGKERAIKLGEIRKDTAFEVLTKNISWEEANKNDWRKTKTWQPGWEYITK